MAPAHGRQRSSGTLSSSSPASTTSSTARWRGGEALKILHLLPSLQRRGAQIFAADLCRALEGRGTPQRVAVLAPGPDGVGLGAVLDGSSVLFIPRGWRGIVELRRMVASWQPDILFAHGGGPLLPAALAQARRGDPVLVYRKIGLTEPWLRKPRWLRLRYQRFLMGRANAILAVSDAVAVEVTGLLRVPPARVRVIRQGVDPSPFLLALGSRERVRDSLGVPTGTAVLLSVGALGWEKHQEAMLRTLAALRASGVQALLLLAGDGPERGRLERLAAKLGLGDAARFLAARADIPELLAAADLLLLTSLTEGLPGVLIEAGMAGVPAVAWDIAGVREVVRDGVTGLVPPLGDETAFVAATLRLLGNPAEARRMGAAAREFCRERFAMERCVEEHLRLFRELPGADA